MKNTKQEKVSHEKNKNSKENIFTIRSYEVTNKTIDSFSDIDEFNNSKTMSNINMSNIFENVAKEKSLANPFTFKTILEDVTQDSILEKSVSAFKKKNLEEKPLKPNNIPVFKERNIQNNNANFESQQENEKYSNNFNNFDKIRSVTPKIERSKINNAPGSTRSITPLDKGEREFAKPSGFEKAQKNNYTNNNNNQNELKNKEQKKTNISNKSNHLMNNELYEQNKENIFEKKHEYKKTNSISKKEMETEKNKINKDSIAKPKEKSHVNMNSNEYLVSNKLFEDYTKNMEEEIEKKKNEIYDLKKANRTLEQENSNLREQLRKNIKEKNLIEDEFKKKEVKLKGDLFELEQQNFNVIKELKELKKENEDKSQLIKDLLLELNNEKKNVENKFKIEKNYQEDESNESSDDASFLKNQYLREKKKLQKKFQENNNINEKFANLFKNINDFNDSSSIKKPPLDNNNVFTTKNHNYSNLKKKENEASIKLLEIMQKNNSKDIASIKTTPDNLSSKRNRKGHISPIDFPSSRNKLENQIEKSQKIANYLESFNAKNINNLFSEDRYRVPSTNPHKCQENPLFFLKKEENLNENQEKNEGKRNLAYILEEKNIDFNNLNSKTPLLINNYSKGKSHNKNDSSSNSSYLSYLQKKNNQNSGLEYQNENEKSSNGSSIFIHSSPRKFNKNLNEVIIDITKRCQTSSNSHLQKVEKIVKDKSLEKHHSNNIMDFKNKPKDPILPKPRNFAEKIIGKEEVIAKNPYLSAGQNRRSSLNIDNEQNIRKVPKSFIHEIMDSTKKERSKSNFSEKYNKDD